MCVCVCVCVCVLCVCVCVCVGGGACFTLEPRVIFVAKLDFTVPLTSVSTRGVCLPILSVTHKFSLCPGEAPLPPAKRRLEGRMPLVFPAESCCVLAPPTRFVLQ